MDIWSVLELDPTEDISAIRRAYAKATRKYNPEDHPEEFGKVRLAYERALAQAQRNKHNEEAISEDSLASISTEKEISALSLDSFLSSGTEVNTYINCPAMNTFRTIYSDSKQRSNKKAWQKYFISDDFLDVWREPQFTAALHDEAISIVKSTAEDLNTKFLHELSITYGIRYTSETIKLDEEEADRLGREYTVTYYYHLLPNAGFNSVHNIVNITYYGRKLTNVNKVEDQMRSAAFVDYMLLLSLLSNHELEEIDWDVVEETVSHYQRAYITDSPKYNHTSESRILLRFPDSLNLIAYIMKNPSTQKKLLEIIWDSWDLKNAYSGSNRIWYGSFHDIVLKRVSDIKKRDEEKLDFFPISKLFLEYRDRFFARNRYESLEEQADVSEFLAKKEIIKALLSTDYVEKCVLFEWVDHRRSATFLNQLSAFYDLNSEFSMAQEVQNKICDALSQLNIVEENLEDEELELPAQVNFSFKNRPFWRYFFTVAFPFAGSLRENNLLAPYLVNSITPSIPWRKNFFGINNENSTVFNPHKITVSLGESSLEILFKYHHIQYLVDGKPIFRPFLSWDEVSKVHDPILFWFLLPMSYANYDINENVNEEINKRLCDIPFGKIPSATKISDCLTGYLCTTREHKETVFVSHIETIEQLYGISVTVTGELLLFKEDSYRRELLQEILSFPDVESAISEGLRQLECINATPIICFNMPVLPIMVVARVESTFYSYLKDNEITEIQSGGIKPLEINEMRIEKYINAYLLGHVARLEITWRDESCYEKKYNSLVLLHEQNRFFCFTFHDNDNYTYRLVGIPEIYFGAAHYDITLEDVGLTSIECYLFHHSTAIIRKNLSAILEGLSTGKRDKYYSANGWSPRSFKPNEYKRVKRELGGFPVEFARNHDFSGFEVPHRPSKIIKTSSDGETTSYEGTQVFNDIINYNLTQFIKGMIYRLEFVWLGADSVESTFVLLKDDDKYMMFFFDDEHRHIYPLVGDTRAYLDAEGKVRKCKFLNNSFEHYLLHSDTRIIRDALDLLIPNIKSPQKILGIFADWAPKVFEKNSEKYLEYKHLWGKF